MISDNVSNDLKVYEVSLIWKEAEYNFASWEKLNGALDWDKAYREALPRILATKNLYDYYMELMKFISLLKDGHTTVSFPNSVNKSLSRLPILTKLFGNKRIITNVKSSISDQIKRWSIIKKVNGIDIDEYIEKNVYPYIWHEKTESAETSTDTFLRTGITDSTVEFELESNGDIKNVLLTRKKGTPDDRWFYNKTDKKHEKTSYKSNSHKIEFTSDNIAIITIDTMMDDNLPVEFYANFSLLEKASGYIIDIRNNKGGNYSNGSAVAALFIGKEFTDYRSLRPIHIGAYKQWILSENLKEKSYEQLVEIHGEIRAEKMYKIPKHIYYDENITTQSNDKCPGVLTAPLVVLISEGTISAAETFVINLDHTKRGIIVGTATCGSSGQTLKYSLESGGGFRICTQHQTYPNGREFINIGVQPHIKCELTLDDYKNDVDSVMNRGLEEIRKLI